LGRHQHVCIVNMLSDVQKVLLRILGLEAVLLKM